MGNDIDFLNSEKRYWGKIHADIELAISEVAPFIPEKRLKERKYYNKASILKEYNRLLDSSIAYSSTKKKSLFGFLKSDPNIKLLQDYKAKNRDTFKQFEKCKDCQCLNCSFECKFQSCSGCRQNSLLTYCDREKINVRKFDNFTLDLTNNDTGRQSKYKVLAVMEDCELDQLYILVENIHDANDKLILYYYPGIKEDTYGEITDPEEFDFIVQTYQQAE